MVNTLRYEENGRNVYCRLCGIRITKGESRLITYSSTQRGTVTIALHPYHFKKCAIINEMKDKLMVEKL